MILKGVRGSLFLCKQAVEITEHVSYMKGTLQGTLKGGTKTIKTNCKSSLCPAINSWTVLSYFIVTHKVSLADSLSG